jgi:hypothetical protein
MTMRLHASLGRVLDDLGGTLLMPAYGEIDAAREVGGVIIHDALDETYLPPRALVLGVGVAEPQEIISLLGELRSAGAAALILRAPLPVDAAVREAVARSEVPLLTLTRGASWDQLAAMLRSILAEGDVGVSNHESVGGVPAGDLFALANAIAALVNAPITIEDRNSQVVAFSGGQHETDQGRIETVLGRHVPERYIKVLTERGVFRDLYNSTSPVLVDSVPAEDGSALMPRTAVAVRAGEEILGSIWAATPQQMNADHLESLRDAAKVVALHLLRSRAGADVERKLRVDLVSTALEGGSNAREALHRLGLADEPVLVLALSLKDDDGTAAPQISAALTGESQRLSNAFAMHLSAALPSASSALLGRVCYGLLPATGTAEESEQRAERIATNFLDRLGSRFNAAIGIGTVVETSHISHARMSADRALRVVSRRRVGTNVARLADVQMDALILELRDLLTARGDRPSGPLARLIGHEGGQDGILLRTLHSWLDAFGDVAVAAASMSVHPNTFRYRLKRAVDLSGIDLTDSNARFLAMLELRVLLRDEGHTPPVPRR